MLRPRRPPSQAWRTFLKNHAKDLIALDFFTVPTATFRVLFVLVVLNHGRRRLVHFNVTEHPTADWTGRQQDVQRLGLTRKSFSIDLVSVTDQMPWGFLQPARLDHGKRSLRHARPGKTPMPSA